MPHCIIISEIFPLSKQRCSILHYAWKLDKLSLKGNEWKTKERNQEEPATSRGRNNSALNWQCSSLFNNMTRWIITHKCTKQVWRCQKGGDNTDVADHEICSSLRHFSDMDILPRFNGNFEELCGRHIIFILLIKFVCRPSRHQVTLHGLRLTFTSTVLDVYFGNFVL